MQTLKSWIITILALGVISGLGYLAFSSIDSGSEYVSNKKTEDLEKENQSLKSQIADLERRMAMYEPPVVETPEETPTPEPTPIVEEKPEPATYKYAKLIAELEQLVKDNISMKLKSRGTRVGSVQNFLNTYNNTSNKVDNDYGEGTKKSVAAFQKAVGLTSDGEAGPATFNKMIEWLKKQG